MVVTLSERATPRLQVPRRPWRNGQKVPGAATPPGAVATRGPRPETTKAFSPARDKTPARVRVGLGRRGLSLHVGRGHIRPAQAVPDLVLLPGRDTRPTRPLAGLATDTPVTPSQVGAFSPTLRRVVDAAKPVLAQLVARLDMVEALGVLVPALALPFAVRRLAVTSLVTPVAGHRPTPRLPSDEATTVGRVDRPLGRPGDAPSLPALIVAPEIVFTLRPSTLDEVAVETPTVKVALIRLAARRRPLLDVPVPPAMGHPVTGLLAGLEGPRHTGLMLKVPTRGLALEVIGPPAGRLALVRPPRRPSGVMVPPLRPPPLGEAVALVGQVAHVVPMVVLGRPPGLAGRGAVVRLADTMVTARRPRLVGKVTLVGTRPLVFPPATVVLPVLHATPPYVAAVASQVDRTRPDGDDECNHTVAGIPAPIDTETAMRVDT